MTPSRLLAAVRTFLGTQMCLNRQDAMRRQDLVLAALAPAGGELHTPVQVQKLLFLIDDQIPDSVGGPHFAFRPYHYGPFDRAVYEELSHLQRAGLVEAVSRSTWQAYRLSAAGQAAGDKALATLDDRGRGYVQKVSDFVRSLSFAGLVAAVYKAYPAMRVNSVFSG